MTDLTGTITTLDRALREKLLLPLLTEHATQGSSYVALSADVEFYVGQSVPGYIPFVRRSDLLLAVGDPVTGPDNRRALALEFVEFGRTGGVPAAFFPVSGAFLAQLASGGLRGIAAGVEPAVFLDGFALEAPRWRKLRHDTRRGQQEGVKCSLTFGAALSTDQEADLVAIWEVWARHRVKDDVPQPVLVPESFVGKSAKRYAIAELGGAPVAFAALVPVPARNGWMVEGLYRVPDSPPGVSETLLALTMGQLRDEGFSVMTLGPSLLAVDKSIDLDLESEADSATSNAVFRWLYAHAPQLLNYRSAHRFKLKFNPDRIEPLYLAFDGTIPDASLIEAFLSATFEGIELSGLVAELWTRLAQESTASTLLPND